MDCCCGQRPACCEFNLASRWWGLFSVQDADDATEQIEREIGIVIECEPTGDEEKRKFTDKTQDELIELLIRAQVRKDRCLLSLLSCSILNFQGS
jgi:hypothetical protein